MDFSDEMLNKAKARVKSDNVNFVKFDINEKWDFTKNKFDLVTCSLILEHIKDINFIFKQANKVMKAGGIFYIGELHPFKQYRGSKARFKTDKGTVVLDCFVHNISDFFDSAKKNNFECIDIKEWFDDNSEVPRLLTMVFKK